MPKKSRLKKGGSWKKKAGRLKPWQKKSIAEVQASKMPSALKGALVARKRADYEKSNISSHKWELRRSRAVRKYKIKGMSKEGLLGLRLKLRKEIKSLSGELSAREDAVRGVIDELDDKHGVRRFVD